MDGYTLARQLRLIPGMQTAVMAAVTGYRQPKGKQAVFAAGFDVHLARPVDSGPLQVWLAQVAEPAWRQARSRSLRAHEAVCCLWSRVPAPLKLQRAACG